MKDANLIMNKLTFLHQSTGFLHQTFRRSKLFFFLFFLSIFIAVPIASDSKEQRKSEEVKKKLIESKKKLATTEENETNTLMQLNKALVNLNNQKKKLILLQDEEAKLVKEAEKVQFQIKEVEKYIASEQETVKKRLVARYKIGSGGYVQILFSAKTPLELSKTAKYVDSIINWDKKTLKNYESKITLLKNSEKDYDEKVAKLNESKASIERQKEDVLKEKNRTETILLSIKKEKVKYQKEVNNLEFLSKKLDTKIEQLHKNIKKDKITSSELNQNSGFVSLKGKLHPPVTGDILVNFGKYKDPVLNIVNQNKGIIIDSKNETKIKAIYRGKVIFADWLRGYGNLIVIDHGDNIYSLYARCMKIFVKDGEQVKDLQVIGSLENDKKERSYLYFELRQGTKPVNPVEWISFTKG